MKSPRLIIFTLLLLVVLSLFATAAFAVSDVSVGGATGYYDYEIDTCSDGNSWQEYVIHLTGVDDEEYGDDEFVVVALDGNGNVIDVDIDWIQAETTDDVYDGVDPGMGEFSNPVSRPFTLVVYDIPYYWPSDENTFDFYNWVIANGTEMARGTFDPSADPACAALPVVQASVGAGVCLNVPSTAVMGDMPNSTQAYWSPGNVSPGLFVNPGTYWVLGVDSTGGYYKIILACQYLWVPVDSMQPSYQAPWSGQPLPTSTVS